MQILSLANHKGGVGKTTSAVNIAACWGAEGVRVLLVDLDPQGSASLSLGVRGDGNDLLQALQKTTSLPVRPTPVTGVDLAPSGLSLAAARQRFTGAIEKELLLRCLKQTSGDWTKVVIDCPPGLDILTMTALWASTHVVIPVEANYLGLSGLTQMLNTVQSMQTHSLSRRVDAIIPCRAHPRRRIHHAVMMEFERLLPGKITPIVRENAALAEAPGLGRPVISSAPHSKGAEDYRQVALWLFNRLGGELT